MRSMGDASDRERYQVQIRAKDGKRIEHTGIKVEFVGSIGACVSNALHVVLIYMRTEMFYDRGTHFDFISMAQEMAAPGELRHTVSYDFEFKNIEKQFESYWGINVKLR